MPNPEITGTSHDLRGYRRAAAKFATGITVILVETSAGLHGMTANAFMSVSLRPLLVAVSVANHARMHGYLAEEAASFTLSVLTQSQKPISDAFAGRLPMADLPASPYERLPSGEVVIREAAAWFCLKRHAAYPSGDHTIFVAEVVRHAAFDRDPLIYYGGAYYLGFDFSVPDQQWKRLTEGDGPA